MDFSDVVARRRMVRRYSSTPVAHDLIERVVAAGVHAPSAGFSQGQRFVVVTDKDVRARVASAAGEDTYVARGFDPWLSVAPVHIILCADVAAYRDRYDEPDKDGTDSWSVPYWWVDIGASLMAILYAAVNEGLSAGFIGDHAISDLHEIVKIPPDILVAGVVTLGYGLTDRGSTSIQRGRTNPNEVVRWQHW